MRLSDLAAHVSADKPFDFQLVEFDYERAPDHDLTQTATYPVVIVGAGPVGLSLAIDLAQRGVQVVLLDDDCRLSSGSRAICFAKRTLEIFDRLGCGQPMVDEGVSWNTGRVFFGSDQLYSFDLLADKGHQRPAFINLQQYCVEGRLAARAGQLQNLQIRWKSRVIALSQQSRHSTITVETPDGCYTLLTKYLVACDGSRSAVRGLMGLQAKGQVFKDRFLIADVKMQADFPAERWFWFDPPFHPGQSVLLHRQPGELWRIDFQLGWDADPEEEKKPENIIPRIRALLAHSALGQADFELVWASVYTFACSRMERFRHGSVLFAGDAAHGVSPFGARGANSGVQDADNLGWKLAAVLEGDAPDTLLDSYASEREEAASENIRHSTRSTDFITPKSAVSRLFRDAVLQLARSQPFARRLVNSGRLSTPSTLHGSSLSTPDTPGDDFSSGLVLGAPMADAPLVGLDGEADWLASRCAGAHFTALVFGNGPQAQLSLHAALETGVQVIHIHDLQAAVLAQQRYDAIDGTVYLLRPDQHVCARWRQATAADISAARDRALGLAPSSVGAALPMEMAA